MPAKIIVAKNSAPHCAPDGNSAPDILVIIVSVSKQ